ncbi:MAG TPA: hypothetical protein VIH66_01695 [Gammaproteobacteria bacterium]
MRTPRIAAGLIGLAVLFISPAQGNNFDAGIIVGDPTGLSIKGWLNNAQAYDAAASWSSGKNDEFYIHADYLHHDYTLIKVTQGRGSLPVYYGIGARILNQDNKDTEAGIRIPVGLDYKVDKMPLSLFVEIVPRLDVTPDTEFELDAAAGVRYRLSKQ